MAGCSRMARPRRCSISRRRARCASFCSRRSFDGGMPGALWVENASPLPYDESMDLTAKTNRLLEVLGAYESVAVAFSAGVDSTVVAAAAERALGDRAIAVTADSPSVPRDEIRLARTLAESIGIAHRVVQTREF